MTPLLPRGEKGAFILVPRPQRDPEGAGVAQRAGDRAGVRGAERQVVELVAYVPDPGLQVPAPILGAEGNREFLLYGTL